jgi:hypothetical protein
MGYMREDLLDLGAKGGVKLCKQTVCFRRLLSPIFFQRQCLHDTVKI